MASLSRGGRQAIHFVDNCACACCAAVQKLFLLLFYEGSTEQLRARAVPVLQEAYTQLLEGAYLDRLQTTAPGTLGGFTGGPGQAGAPAPGDAGGERPGGPTLPPSGPDTARPGDRDRGEGATSSVGEVTSPGTHEAAGEGPSSPGETRPPLARKRRVKEEPSTEEEKEARSGRDRRRRRDSGERRGRERTRAKTGEAEKTKRSEEPKPSRREGLLLRRRQRRRRIEQWPVTQAPKGEGAKKVLPGESGEDEEGGKAEKAKSKKKGRS